MASIFTYQDEPPRIQSPWSTPGTSTPQSQQAVSNTVVGGQHAAAEVHRLEPEHQDGPTEYKLHLLLRPRRKFVSTSTTSFISISQQYFSLLQQPTGVRQSSNETIPDRSQSQPSAQARQTRLQQLTTQLLWRLQQSSPFHSSSNADLVLPVLPEATPRLGVPERPAKLLPGLEESQGALYEIGVADDGTLVGLVKDEMQESLGNLQAMSASLGCTTNVLRHVAVGTCEWIETDGELGKFQTRRDTLWVAEVLVYPDSRFSADTDVLKAVLDGAVTASRSPKNTDLTERIPTEQMRVTLVGTTASGKSSLLGTLSTSTLDNGRGRSRLSLLKHRHEIASGITSSVAHELVGYTPVLTGAQPVINYASGNVSSWIDVHNLADRLVFLSDSPGLPRFAKSALRSLISWRPSWTILCIAADDASNRSSLGVGVAAADGNADNETGDNADHSLAYLDLCLRLHVPLMVVITKMDLANKVGLRLVLAKVLSAVKAAARKPVMLSNSSVLPLTSEHGGAASELHIRTDADQKEVNQLVALMEMPPRQISVPILMTSAVTGLGISKMHALLQNLPIACKPVLPLSLQTDHLSESSLFHVDEVFSIPPSRVYALDAVTRVTNRGIVLCGHVARGSLFVGETISLGPFLADAEVSMPRTPQHALRTSPCGAQATSMEPVSTGRARSYQAESPRAPTPRPQAYPVFVSVRIVSLRTLRLPVTEMQKGETGTIGVEPLEDELEPISLGRARKGMVLTSLSQRMLGYHSFSATFPASDFAQASAPVLILGGHAIVYVNSIRAAVKVSAVSLDEDDRNVGPATPSAPEDAEIFRFDGDDKVASDAGDAPNGPVPREERKEIKLSFRFGSTVEWMESGDQVLVVPAVTAAGPVAGPTPAVNTSGVAGYVGRVCELFS